MYDPQVDNECIIGRTNCLDDNTTRHERKFSGVGTYGKRGLQVGTFYSTDVLGSSGLRLREGLYNSFPGIIVLRHSATDTVQYDTVSGVIRP